MTIWNWLWMVIGVAAAVVEAVALTNSTRGDTLSEHVWAFVGVRPASEVKREREQGGPDAQMVPAEKLKIRPMWTLRVCRFIILAGLTWLVAHFLTGGWV